MVSIDSTTGAAAAAALLDAELISKQIWNKSNM